MAGRACSRSQMAALDSVSFPNCAFSSFARFVWMPSSVTLSSLRIQPTSARSSARKLLRPRSSAFWGVGGMSNSPSASCERA